MSAEKGLYRLLFRLLRPYWKWMAAGAFCGLIAIVSAVGLLSLAGWFLSATAFAGLTLAGAKLFNFFLPSIGVRLFAILRTLARYTERIVSHDATFRILSGLRRWFYAHLEPLGPARLTTFRSGDLLNRITADIDALDKVFLRVLSPSLVAATMVVAVGLFLNIFDATIALAFGMFMMLAGFAGPLATGRAGAAAGKQLALKMADLRIRTVEGIQGLAELLVFGAGESHLENLDRDNRRLVQVQHRMAWIRGLSIAWVTLLAGLSVLTALYLGTELVNSGKLDGANLALICLAVLASYEAVLMLPAAYQYLGQTREAGQRLLEIVDAAPEVVFPPQSEQKPERFDLQFEGVDFCYHPQAPPALEGIDIEIEHGQQVAVVGETGSGKSTLVNLLVRFWNPQRGKILIGGRDIGTLSEADLRQSMAVVPQQAHLFNATIRDNLALARPAATESEVLNALALAGILDFVQQLPEGLDTWVGESGRLVSGGQARRLAVARAALCDAPIWILDEPTEGLDAVTERRMMERLFDHTRGKTLLLITHRLAALDRMDGILVMEAGRIVEQGTHAALLKGDTRYAAMHARIDV